MTNRSQKYFCDFSEYINQSRYLFSYKTAEIQRSTFNQQIYNRQLLLCSIADATKKTSL